MCLQTDRHTPFEKALEALMLKLVASCVAAINTDFLTVINILFGKKQREKEKETADSGFSGFIYYNFKEACYIIAAAGQSYYLTAGQNGPQSTGRSPFADSLRF